MMMVVETLEMVEIPPVVARAEFPSPVFIGFGSILVFRCFGGALLEEASIIP
jgi:hypothetical protein